jgi:hypothetical protein
MHFFKQMSENKDKSISEIVGTFLSEYLFYGMWFRIYLSKKAASNLPIYRDLRYYFFTSKCIITLLAKINRSRLDENRSKLFQF